MIFDHIRTIFFIFVMQMNLRLVLRFDPILSTQMQTILSSLFFQKIRLSELKLAISFKESNRTCLEHSRTFLDLQICPRDRNCDCVIVNNHDCHVSFFLFVQCRIQGTGPGGPGPPLFLDQIEARRRRKKFKYANYCRAKHMVVFTLEPK